jgi:hypothetical protein
MALHSGGANAAALSPEERFEQTKRTLLYQKRSLQLLRAGIN